MATQKGRNWSSGDIVTAANLSSIERGVSAVAEEYTPTTWTNGNTVTAAGLNNIEQGIVNAGGGSSDFSTATVTIDATNMPGGEPTFYWMFPIVAEDCISVYDHRQAGYVDTQTVVLYKGECQTYWQDINDSTITGSATCDDGLVTITGDCTFTF